MTEDIHIIDVRSVDHFNKKSSIDNIPHANLREKLGGLDRNKATVTYCNKGGLSHSKRTMVNKTGLDACLSLSSHLFWRSVLFR